MYMYNYVYMYMYYVYVLYSLHTCTCIYLYFPVTCSYQSNMAKDILDTIMSIQPKDSSGGGGETRETIVGRLASDMLSKLPPDYIPHEVRARLKKMGAMSSMNIFLKQEIDRMQRVITLVRITLSDLQLAIEGTIIMSEVRTSFYMYMYQYTLYMYAQYIVQCKLCDTV